MIGTKVNMIGTNKLLYLKKTKISEFIFFKALAELKEKEKNQKNVVKTSTIISLM